MAESQWKGGQSNMPPIREYICIDCGHEQEHVVSDGGETPQCCHCESTKMEKLFSITGGYKMNSGGSSTRPKGAGSRPKQSK